MRNLAGGDELRKIVSAERLPITVTALNVDDDGSVSDAVHRVLVENGRIDILVNNAGVGGRGSVEDVPMEVFREVMETNFFGGLRCIKAVIPSMRERRNGCIVNVTSVAGRIASAALGPYAASKWAFEALSECLAQEMKAFNVRVAVIEPGVIATPISGKGRPGPKDSPYPHLRRLAARFRASLMKAPSPYVVGELIQQIVEGDSWQLRYPVGPDAVPLIRWRAGKTDEEIVDLGAESDADYKMRMKREFGLDLNL
jgi:NAD(P)-dependent dehydrogenase (short-subunit alcohol dehydrogenase family)